MLPILLSIPHGGNETPIEVENRVCITPHDLFDDSDAHTLDIYDIDGVVARVVKTDIARAFVDMNRAPDERPPHYPDGVVKSTTCLDRPIYAESKGPDRALTELLIDRYYRPYHEKLNEAIADPRVRLMLDCHSMLPTAPPIEASYGKARPLFCLSNGNGDTAPVEVLEHLANVIAQSFGIEIAEIGLNDPFQGGYITRTYGGGKTPVLQVEMNRSLYLSKPWFDRDKLTVDRQRLEQLRTCFRSALERLRF